ncbi:MAG: mandelate racemase/muconate lactonizing enzyme family protein, partial [Clostridiales bacterium]|nr:mandelate racemase/muconate lactonizing enzyme family protein [Clostridiales bacterium]
FHYYLCRQLKGGGMEITMKIEKVECIPMIYHMKHPIYSGTGKCNTRQMLLIRIYTDTGLVGLGEAATFGGPVYTTQVVVENEIAPLLIGEDPVNTERLWHKCFYAHFQHGRGGIFISALSGIDIALWDLKGKIAGMPVYKLLGGFCNQVPVYASGGFYKENEGIKELVQEVENYANLGMHGVKIKVARTGSPFSLRVFNNDVNCKMLTLEEDIERVAAVKKALGNECPLMLDANTNWDYFTALEAGKAYDKIGVHFLEEPVRTDDYEGSAKLAKELVTKIAGYETECLTTNYLRMMRMGAVDIVQPDLSWCGGITEGYKITILAASHFIECATHVWNSGIIVAASAHLSCAVPNGATMEYDMTENAFRTELMVNPLTPDHNGMITLSDEPGLGVDVREEIIAKYRLPDVNDVPELS